jgi:hypothetical protein
MKEAAQDCWQKNPLLAWREIEGETVIISPDESVLHELNDTGSFIWRHLDGQHTAAQIAGLLAAEYDVTPETALQDIEALLADLAQRKLLVPARIANREGG